MCYCLIGWNQIFMVALIGMIMLKSSYRNYAFDGSKYSSGRGTVASMHVASMKFSRLRTKSDNLLVVDELSLLMICQFQNYSGCEPLELKCSSSCVYWLDWWGDWKLYEIHCDSYMTNCLQDYDFSSHCMGPCQSTLAHKRSWMAQGLYCFGSSFYLLSYLKERYFESN